MRWEAQEPLCSGLAALEFSGLKLQDGACVCCLSDCIPWRTVLLGSSPGKQLSQRMSDSVKCFTEHSGLDGLTLHDNVKFLFLFEHSTWARPWSVRARVGAVNTLGPMADGVTAQSQPGSAGTTCRLHLGRPSFERNSVGGVPVSLHKLFMPFCSN